MGYWGEVSRRAWSSSRKTAKIETRQAIVVLILSQTILAFILWRLTGDAGVTTRIVTTALPFLLIIPLYVWEFVATPAKMARELDAAKEDALAALEKATKTARDPDGIYQFGRHVGKVDTPRVSLSEGKALFEALFANALNPEKPFEYRDHVLKIAKFDVRHIVIEGGRRTEVFGAVVADIIGAVAT
jgi:hypothetical protein